MKTKDLEDEPLESLIKVAGTTLREIVFHSDGRIVAKTGGQARNPKKLYGGKTANEAVAKLIKENNDIIGTYPL
jgi:hypothetical protein